MHTLPLLEPARSTLEKCVFCPKLCRSACPVSNAEPKETITPWGKMSMAYFLAHGDVPTTSSFARPAWACTGCLACRESCDHGNDVPKVLFSARAGMMDLGVAPPSASRVVARFEQHATRTREAVRELGARATVRRDADTALLVGCTYARGAPREAGDAIAAATGLIRGPVALVEACCGLPLLHAGDAGGFARQARLFATETSAKKSLLVADAGCALTVRTHYRGIAVLSPRVELLVEHAAKDLARIDRVSREGRDTEPVRYHDPCLLGRGLGIYDAPRAVLSRALGRAPDEFDTRREKARCSGAGGLLPVTMPAVSRAIADTRLEEHGQNGGGRIVTACAGSLLAFRRRSRVKVDDLVTWMARAISPWRP
jgi:Fe-S oxidoreductase